MKKIVCLVLAFILCSAGVSAAEADIFNPKTESRVFEYDFADGETASEFLIKFDENAKTENLSIKIKYQSLSGKHQLTAVLKDAQTDEELRSIPLEAASAEAVTYFTGYYDEEENYVDIFKDNSKYYIELKDASKEDAKGIITVGAYHLTDTNNFDVQSINPAPSMVHIKKVTLGENETSIKIDFTSVTNPFSPYYISLYKLDLRENIPVEEQKSGYIVKYFGPISTKGFTFTGLESGETYRVSITSAVNFEYVSGIISAE